MKVLPFLSLISIICVSISCSENDQVIHVSSSSSNDLYQVLLKEKNVNAKRYDTPLSAVKQAKIGGGVLILADEYPRNTVNISREFFDLVLKKDLRIYLEYPSFLPGIQVGKPVSTTLERAVINSSLFEGKLDSLDILSINGLNYLPTNVSASHIVAAKVAGFDKAVYGLPDKITPLLFELPDYPVMVATTNLSQLVRGRYAPKESWAAVWKEIFKYISPGSKSIDLTWDPVVNTSYTKTETMRAGQQKESIKKGIEWFINAKMLPDTSYDDLINKMVKDEEFRMKWNGSIPIGDGSCGVFECISSQIDEHGNQPIGIVKRGDCISETAMAFAAASKVLNQGEYADVSKNLLDFYLIHSSATKNEYGDENHGAYGLIPWGISNYAWYKASYGDDNARFLMSALTASALTSTNRWDETLMKSLVALMRTTGKNGFRGSRIDLPDFKKNGWKFYRDRDIVNVAPHFEAYLWACMLWAYDKTGDKFFLERTENAIRTTMDNYPEGWRWTNGLAQEKARMILPLSWLVRIDDSQENRAMLLHVVDDLLLLQDSCGAIREELGELKMGKYPPPQSNEAYGTNEASLIGNNGDPVSDLLYTTNFAFLGLHEAYYATKNPRIKAAHDKLAEFLVRIQVEAKSHPEIDGGWLRAFDYERYEHWGSDADHGWGAWCIESGWTQGWIVSILAMREMDTSIWDLTKESNVGRFYGPLKKKMIF